MQHLHRVKENCSVCSVVNFPFLPAILYSLAGASNQGHCCGEDKSDFGFCCVFFILKKRLFLFQSRNGILLILFDPEKSKHYKGYVQVFLEVKNLGSVAKI